MRSPRSLAYNHPPLTSPGRAVTEAPAELLPLISRLAEIAETKATLEAEEKNIKDQLRDTLEVGSKVTVNGSPVLAIRSYRRFSADLAKENLSPELIALCTVPSIDGKQAQKVLPPALYDTCLKHYQPQVVLL